MVVVVVVWVTFERCDCGTSFTADTTDGAVAVAVVEAVVLTVNSKDSFPDFTTRLAVGLPCAFVRITVKPGTFLGATAAGSFVAPKIVGEVKVKLWLLMFMLLLFLLLSDKGLETVVVVLDDEKVATNEF